MRIDVIEQPAGSPGHRPPGEVPDVPERFGDWLARNLRSRRMSQRQLADRTGVDHSTISRLIRSSRMPSLQTATRLAQCFGSSDWPVAVAEVSREANSSRPGQVERALRADPALTDAGVRHVMKLYLAIRHVDRAERVARGHALPTGRAMPVVGRAVREVSRSRRHAG